MEVGVWLVGVLLRLLNAVLTPLFWIWRRDSRRVPPITNPLFLRSVTELVAAIRTGEITSEELVTAYIERVKEVNPLLNAVVDERYEAAVDDAKAVDQEIQEARRKGNIEELMKKKPLLGVPFTVKESLCLAGLSNAVGCLEHAGRRATTDGAAVALVRQAGAIPLLVTNTPELCLGWETTNLLRGTTNNPYRLDRTPGGSSGGEAALLASGASPFGLASDIAGSIRVPAAFCGVFGHKPTPGITPIEGHLPTLNDPAYPKYLTVGPMARRAEDLPLLLRAMAGAAADRLRLDEPVDMADVRVHYMTEASRSAGLIGVHDSIKQAILNAVQYLGKECGCEISEDKFEDLEDSVELSISVLFSMKDIPNMLQDPANPKRDKSLLVEMIKYAFGAASRSLQALSFTLITKTQLFIPESRQNYYSEKAKKLREHMKSTFGSRGVLLYPSFSTPAPAHGGVVSRASGVMYTMVYNVLGLPAAAVPVGLRDGLPIAIQVVAAPNQDRLCLAVARQLEIGFGGWRPPQ